MDLRVGQLDEAGDCSYLDRWGGTSRHGTQPVIMIKLTKALFVTGQANLNLEYLIITYI